MVKLKGEKMNSAESQAYKELRKEIVCNELNDLSMTLFGIGLENEKTNKQFAFGVYRAMGEVEKRLDKLKGKTNDKCRKI